MSSAGSEQWDCTLILGSGQCNLGSIPWVLCRLYHALRRPTRLGAARPVSQLLSVKMVKKVRGPKAEPPKQVLNRDVMHVTGIT